MWKRGLLKNILPIRKYSIFIFFLLLYSCQKPVKEEVQIDYHPEDSIALKENFEAALSKPEKKDSLFRMNDSLLQKHRGLEDVYQYGLGRFYIQSGKFEEAGKIIATVLKKYQDTPHHPSLAKFYNLLGAKAAYQNQQESAIQYFQKALDIFEKSGEELQAAIIQFNLANIFLGRLEYQKAHQYSLGAHQAMADLKDSTYLPICKALLAITTVHNQDNEQARIYATEALALSKDLKNVQGIALSYYALGEIEINEKNYPQSLQYLRKAEDLSQQYKLHQVLLSSKAGLLNGLQESGKYQEAIKVGEEALEIAVALKNVEVQYSLFKNLANCYFNSGQYKEAFISMKKAEEEYRNKSNVDNQKIIQELLINYETEKMNNIILAQEGHIARNKTWTVVLIFVIASIIFILFSFIRSHRQKRKMLLQQKETDVLLALTQGEEKERRRFADELHDGIASHLIALKFFIENETATEKNQRILNLVSRAHKEVRSVAHNLMPINFDEISLIQAIRDFCSESSTDKCPILFFGNQESVSISKAKAHVLYRIVQECIQNSLKHSEASKIEVQCLVEENKLKIMVEDNGIGFDWEILKESTGFQNMIVRLKQIDAQLEIDSQVGRGTFILIQVRMKKL